MIPHILAAVPTRIAGQLVSISASQRVPASETLARSQAPWQTIRGLTHRGAKPTQAAPQQAEMLKCLYTGTCDGRREDFHDRQDRLFRADAGRQPRQSYGVAGPGKRV